MSIRYWLYAIALGGCLIGTAVAVPDQSLQRPNYKAEEPGKDAAEPDKGQAEQTEDVGIAGVSALTAKPTSDSERRNTKAENAENADEDNCASWERCLFLSDGIAQWVMAGTGVAALCFSIYAVLLLRRQLRLTREMFATENRAWLKIKEIETPTEYDFDETGCQFWVRFTIENIGKSPAYNISGGSASGPVADNDATVQREIDALRDGYRGFADDVRHSLFPGEVGSFAVECVFTNEAIEEVEASLTEDSLPIMAMTAFCIFYRIDGDHTLHETVRPYLVGGLDLQQFGQSMLTSFSLVRADMVTGSTT